MRRAKITVVCCGLLLGAAACHGGGAKGGKTMALELSSRSFSSGGDIPTQYTCDGKDISPELHWGEPPAGTRSFALIADDPDAPVGTWVHWVLFNLPAQTRNLPENLPKTESLENGALHGRNDFRKIGYGGPCPPPGKPHHYFFKLYALDTTLNLKAGATKAEVERAMKGHILAQGEWMGMYGR
jgi:Raf kinase inhibitor-like YbhB/YbcL family protein